MCLSPLWVWRKCAEVCQVSQEHRGVRHQSSTLQKRPGTGTGRLTAAKLPRLTWNQSFAAVEFQIQIYAWGLPENSFPSGCKTFALRYHWPISAAPDKRDTIQANILLKEVKEVRAPQGLARRADFLPITQLTKGFRWQKDLIRVFTKVYMAREVDGIG